MKRTLVESVLRNRLALFFVLLLFPLACWVWIIAMARDMYGAMNGASAWMMTPVWDAPRLLLLWAMWAAMMAAMMLPSATPILLLYAGAARNRDERGAAGARIYALAAGYVFVWALFSAGATALQRILAGLLLLTPMMESATPYASAALLALAGIYQLTPWKHACLRSCRSPIAFLGSRWRGGISGAFRMGAEHGATCAGCCWALMLLLFAGGVMNLAVILALTVWVIVEKAAPLGHYAATFSSLVLLGAAGWVLLR